MCTHFINLLGAHNSVGGSRKLFYSLTDWLCNCKLTSMTLVYAEYTANRLIRYYTYFGFSKVKEVCSTDFLDLIIWGGVGTKMKADVQVMLKRWGLALRESGKQL